MLRAYGGTERIALMRTVITTVILLSFVTLANAQTAASPKPAFSTPPQMVKTADGLAIKFAVAAPTDADVAVLDAKGKVVRHLGSAMLGDNPPEPFVKGLEQQIAWDGNDDAH